MFSIHRSRSLFLGSAVFLALALFAPGVVNADEVIPLVAPVAGPATDAVPVIAPVAAPSWDETSGYGSVEATRALVVERALLSGDIGSMQEDRLLAIVAAALSWDETSGYGAVEASRAANALLAPVAGPSWDETSGYASVEASRAVIGHPATSTTQVPADVRWAPAGTIDRAGVIEASHAVSLDYLPVALERGTRAESPVLWTILHPEDAAVAVPHRTQR
jgi:hypothetical protein